MAVRTYTAPDNEIEMLDSELDSLADDDLTNGVTVFDSTATRYPHMVAELYLGATAIDLSSANSNPVCRYYLIPSYDGTTYADAGDLTNELVPQSYSTGQFVFNKEVSATRAIIDLEHVLGPYKYKATLFNDLGAAFPAAGAIVKMKSYTDDIS